MTNMLKYTKQDIVIIRSNSIIYDSRVGKIIRSLKKRYFISVLGWNREGISIKTNCNYKVDLFKLKAPFGKLSLVAYFPLFWIWIFIKLLVYRPKIVHACDLDTALPCYLYKAIFRKKMVFDVFDRYAMGYVPYLPPKFRLKSLYSLVNISEEFFSKKANVLVNVSEELLKTFRGRPKHCATIMNCPEEHIIGRIDSREHKEEDVLTLVYTGPIVRNRGFQNIGAAIKDLNGVEFVIAGRVIDKTLLDQILKLSNVKYKGLLQYGDALALEASSDVMVILYDLKDQINNFAMPNKLFEAMMCGLPIITNIAPKLVYELDCGIIVDYENVNQIRTAIIYLRDDKESRKRLGNNSHKAFLQKYSWAKMEQELYRIYEDLLST
jgi:glycosyltransferase involved in cell wall biosynthesis